MWSRPTRSMTQVISFISKSPFFGFFGILPDSLHSRLFPSQFWIPDSGFSIPDSGFWIPDSGFWIPDSGFWIFDLRFWILDSGFSILDSGFEILDFGFWILDSEFWILDSGLFELWLVDSRFWLFRHVLLVVIKKYWTNFFVFVSFVCVCVCVCARACVCLRGSSWTSFRATVSIKLKAPDSIEEWDRPSFLPPRTWTSSTLQCKAQR